MGLTSSPHIDAGGAEVGPMSGLSLLEARAEGISRKEGMCQEDIGVSRYQSMWVP